MLLEMTTPDLDLLRHFARDHAQDAFAEIVRRHLDLVYSAALRQVRSPQLAEEIAQSVFTDLARQADRLKPDTLLTAWLHAVTRRTAIDVIRQESRRQLREQIAVEMNAMNAAERSAGGSPAWSEIEPWLDQAVAALDETDRAAVLLRYFENKSLREVGAQLGVSDAAAQKRVSRAVEKLREFFANRKITVGAGGLTLLLSANAVQSAPAGLAAAISAAALASTAAVSTSTVIAATKTLAMTTLQKIAVAATVGILAGGGIYEARQAAQLRDQVQTLQQQQAPLAGQIQELQRERDDATNRLAGLLTENAQLQSNSNEAELLKLRGEVGLLQQQAEAAGRKAQTAEQRLVDLLSVKTQFKKHEVSMVNDAKQIGLAMMIFSGDNNGLYPTNYEQMTNELGGYAALTKLDVYDFDLLNIGPDGHVPGINPTNVSASDHPDMVVLRERRARQAPDGSWNRIYGYLDGRVVTATSYDGNFAAWEKANTYSPPSDANQ